MPKRSKPSGQEESSGEGGDDDRGDEEVPELVVDGVDVEASEEGGGGVVDGVSEDGVVVVE